MYHIFNVKNINRKFSFFNNRYTHITIRKIIIIFLESEKEFFYTTSHISNSNSFKNFNLFIYTYIPSGVTT